MTTPTAPARLAATGGTEVCRLTVTGPARRADLAVPVTATVGELLPIMLRHVADDTDRDRAWALQRLGGPPLDPGGTCEALGLRDGEVLYLSPVEGVLPELNFDDVSVGVAHSISARPDHWRPEFTRMLLLGVACVALVAYAFGVHGAHPQSVQPLYFGGAAFGLAAGAALVTRLLDDRTIGLVTGIGACVFAALAGLAARHAPGGFFTADRESLLICGACVVLPAALLPVAGRLPLAPFGAVAGCALCAVIGGTVASALRWDAARTAAVLAVIVFATTVVDLRVVLRVARLRVPLLPHTAQELQQDIEPDPEALITRRTGLAVSYLNSLFITAAALFAVAFGLLVRSPDWIGWTLATVFATAVLLRARSLTLAWQRAPLALSGVAGLVFVVETRLSGSSPALRALVLTALLAAAAGLLTAARRLPGRRLLPIWGQIADTLETWSAIALVPLLLQLLHVYAYFRALIG